MHSTTLLATFVSEAKQCNDIGVRLRALRDHDGLFYGLLHALQV